MEIQFDDIVGKILPAALSCFEKKAKDIAIPALKLVEGNMKQRIFNQAEASDNSQIGDYRSNWRKVRERAGRQTSKKDYFFKGNLSNDITTGTNRGEFVLGFATDRSTQIAEGLQNQDNKTVFKPSDQELKELSLFLGKQVQKCLEKNLPK